MTRLGKAPQGAFPLCEPAQSRLPAGRALGYIWKKKDNGFDVMPRVWYNTGSGALYFGKHPFYRQHT